MNPQYENQTEKSAAAKRLANMQGISMQEAEQQLHVNAYLQEQQLWTHGSLHHEYLLLQMFQHTAVTSWSAHGHSMC